MPAYVGSLRELLGGHLGTVTSEVLTFTDALTWSGAQVVSGTWTVTGAFVSSGGYTISGTGTIANGLTVTTPAIAGAAISGTVTDSATTTKTGTFDMSGATVTYRAILNADVSASADIARSKLAQDALQVYATELSAWRQADQAVMGITGTAGDHFFDVATNVHRLVGNTPSSSTVTDISLFQFVIPPEYEDGETISFRAACKVDTAADTNTIQAEIFEANATTGAVGGDLATGGAIAVTSSAAFKTWTITASGLVAGDRLNIKLTTINDDADGSDGIVSIFSLDFLIDIKG